MASVRESVWDYPRPPRVERTSKRLRVVVGGETVADTTRGWRVLETSHPPVYYFPPEDVRAELLRRSDGASSCEWKGQAAYWDVITPARTVPRMAWSYPRPTSLFADLRDHLAFYAGPAEACYVDDERVEPQPGGFYGGWITRDLDGPFKGAPGTAGW